MSRDQMELYKEAFELFDRDKTGLISVSELGDVIRASGQNPTEADIRELLSKSDKNRDSNLDFSEFLRLMSGGEGEELGNDSNEALREAFKQFDTDNSGFVSKDELQFALTHIGEKLTDKEADEMMKLGDQDRDGFLNYEEFVMLTSDKPHWNVGGKRSKNSSRYSRMEEEMRSPAPKGTASVAPMGETQKREAKSDKAWIPYESAWTETPILWFLHWGLRYWIRFRQTLLRNPLFQWRLPFPFWKPLNRCMTLAEIVLLLLWLGGTVAVTVCAVVFKWDVESSGSIAVIPTALTFALSTKNSVCTFLLGIPFERQIFWHKLLALTAISWGWAHGCIDLYGLSSEEGEEDEEEETTSGLVFTILMSVLVAVSLKPVRRFVWNIFYFLHILLFIAVAVYGVIHGAGGILFGVAVWAFDYIIRHLYLALIRNPKMCTAVRLPSNVVRFSFPKEDMEYSPGQYVFIMVPEVNIFEWHPFSLSSSPHHDKVSIHIRVLGNWTQSLYKILEKNNGPKEMRVFMHGPYGSPEIDIDNDKYQLFLLISGGIGITPMQSLCNHLVYQQESQGRPLKKVWFVWSCADKYMIQATFEHDREWAGDVNRDVGRLPMSFQPDNLGRITTDQGLYDRNTSVFDSNGPVDVLHTEFYLTRIRNRQEDYASANIRPELQQYVRYGRPKLEEIFSTMESYAVHVKEKCVAVMVCGPPPLVHDVRSLSSSMSGDGVRFDFHGEVFQF